MYKNLFKIREMLREIRITKETNLPWNDVFLKNREESIDHNLYEYIRFMSELYESFRGMKKICRCPLSFDTWLKAEKKGCCSGEARCFKNCPFRDIKFKKDIESNDELIMEETENKEVEEEENQSDVDNFENYIRENFQEEDKISIKQLLDYIIDFKGGK